MGPLIVPGGGGRKQQQLSPDKIAVDTRSNEVLRDCRTWFVKSRVHYMEVLFHTLLLG